MKFKSNLLKRGVLAARHLPNQHNRLSSTATTASDVNTDLLSPTEQDSLKVFTKNENYTKFETVTSAITNKVLESDDTHYKIKTTSDMYTYTTSNLNSFIQPVEEWTSEQVAQWLLTNDLGEYSDIFIEKDINGERLVD